ncbi:MAG: CapA family protein [Clostridiales bacterium]|nr:CapA family protein [Clostridiales bacterium]
MKKKYIFLMLSLGILFLILGFVLFTVGSNISHGRNSNIQVEKEIENDISKETEIEEPKISNIRLLAAGDIMFHLPQFKSAYDTKTQTYDFKHNFKHIKNYVKEADIAIGNFETVTREGIGYSGYPRFNTPKESLSAIKDAGFDIMSTANNHCLDQGKKGLTDTIDNIKANNMKNIGTYKHKEDNKILIEEIDGIKLGFLSYTYGLNGLDATLTREELSFMVNLIDENRIESDLKKARVQDLDLIIVSIHWGNEYQREPSAYQIELGEKMIEWGADIILGSHPHVIQKSQIINKDGEDKFIIYSLGNFLSNQRGETIGNSYTEDGLMIEFEIEKDFSDENTIIKGIRYLPTWVRRYKEGNKLYYEILPIGEILEGNMQYGEYDVIKERIKKSYEYTMEKMVSFP